MPASCHSLPIRRRLLSDSPAFEANPEMLLAIGELARMYGRLPHEILELDPYELGLAMLVYRERDMQSTRMMETIGKAGMPIFPCVIMKG